MGATFPRTVSRLRPLTKSPSRVSHLRQQGKATGSAATVSHEPPPIHDFPPLPRRHSPQPRPLARDSKLDNVKPFSHFLTDNFSRQHDYLRISITERCNLRCTYCMPEEGVPLSPPSDLLTTTEISYLSALFVSQGVTKIRLTGGEPTIRKDIVPLMHDIGNLRRNGLKELCLTTNGIALHRKLDSMAEAGLTGVNLSLDTLDPFQFQILTRRKGFDAVMRSIDRILEMNKFGAGIQLKINCVVMRGINEREIIPFVEMGMEKDVEVRFIEYMPFDGNKWSQNKMLSYREMLELIREKYPSLMKARDRENDTSKTYQVPGFVGRIGFITSMTHNFCGTCNRLRITSDGNLKVCLFGNAEVSLRDLLRKDNGGQPIDEEVLEVIKKVEMDRRQALPGNVQPLGYGERERELLEVIGMAVKRKKEKHAGMGELETMKNRPMILIDEPWQIVDQPYPQPTWQSQQNPIGPNRMLARRTAVSLVQRPGPSHLLSTTHNSMSLRTISTTTPKVPPQVTSINAATSSSATELPHLTPTSEIHLISTSQKSPTYRLALATGHVTFSNPTPLRLIRSHSLKKGDVLAVARVAGIQAVKNASTIIPLAHPGVPVEGCVVKVKAVDGSNALSGSRDENDFIGVHGGVRIHVSVETTAKTGLEMEALSGVVGAALTVVDMCKGVDKNCEIGGVRVVGKKGGRSGGWGVLSVEEDGHEK